MFIFLFFGVTTAFVFENLEAVSWSMKVYMDLSAIPSLICFSNSKLENSIYILLDVLRKIDEYAFRCHDTRNYYLIIYLFFRPVLNLVLPGRPSPDIGSSIAVVQGLYEFNVVVLVDLFFPFSCCSISFTRWNYVGVGSSWFLNCNGAFGGYEQRRI